MGWHSHIAKKGKQAARNQSPSSSDPFCIFQGAVKAGASNWETKPYPYLPYHLEFLQLSRKPVGFSQVPQVPGPRVTSLGNRV